MYNFCGGDPVNRSDPMGLFWYWNPNTGDWEWIGGGTPTAKPAPYTGTYGHHYVTRTKVARVSSHISDDALKYLESGEGMFTGWPKDVEAHEWHNRSNREGVSHTMYDNYTENYLTKAIAHHQKNGTKMTLDEAVEFGEFMKGNIQAKDLKYVKMKDVDPGYVAQQVRTFNRATEKARDELAIIVSARKARAELQKAEEALKARKEAVALEEAAAAKKLGSKNGLRGGLKGAIGIIGLDGLNDFARKTIKEEKPAAQAAGEVVVETVEGVKATPGMIASVPGEIKETANAYSSAVENARANREDQQRYQWNSNFQSDDFNPYAGVKEEGRALFSPVDGAAETGKGAVQYIRETWLWWTED